MTAEFFIAPNMSFGLLIRLERIRQGLRQVDVAEKAGVTQAEVSALERGLYVIPGVRRHIFNALELHLQEGAYPNYAKA